MERAFSQISAGRHGGRRFINREESEFTENYVRQGKFILTRTVSFPGQKQRGRQVADQINFKGTIETDISEEGNVHGKKKTFYEGTLSNDEGETQTKITEEGECSVIYSKEIAETVTLKYENVTLREMRKDLVSFISEAERSAECLQQLSDRINAVFKGATKAKIAGSSVAIAGGIVSAVGFGLSFVTFGSSVILCIVGAVVSGSGGIAAGAASVIDVVYSSKQMKAAEQIIEMYNKQLEIIKKNCVGISERIDNIETAAPEWVHFWGRLVLGSSTVAGNLSWSCISKPIIESAKLTANIATDGVGAGAKAGASVFRAAGSTAARGVHIAGGVVGILLLPLDIHTLVTSSIDLHKGNLNKVAETIRKTADTIRAECPTIKEVDEMIECTLVRMETFEKQPTTTHRKNFSRTFNVSYTG